ncbi:MAG: hypothetical protein ACI4MQ_05845 [Candidatus Coproplasma sp.]
MADFRNTCFTVLEFAAATEVIDKKTENRITLNRPSIVEIAAVKIEKGKIVEHYSTFVAPEGLTWGSYKFIEDEDLDLKGVTTAHLIGASCLKDVIGRLFEFIEGSTVILRRYYICDKDSAYNLLKEHALSYGYLFNNPVIDINSVIRAGKLKEKLDLAEQNKPSALEIAKTLSEPESGDETLIAYDIPFETERNVYVFNRDDSLGWALAIAQLATKLLCEIKLEDIDDEDPF